jgi:uncharacterized protein (DUF3084 family)
MAEETDLRISVARIEGMLTATLARHDQRLDQHENTLSQHDQRLNDKGKLIARHDERIASNLGRIEDLESNNSSRFTRFLASSGVLIAIPACALALFELMSP